MTNCAPQNLKRFMYLDAEGIESLYAQTVTRSEVESTSVSGRGRKTRLSGKVSLGNAIGSLFGLLDLKGEADSTSSIDSTESVKRHFATEQKLSVILKELKKLGQPSLFTDLQSAAEFTSENQDAVFIQMRLQFDLPQFYGGDGIAKINKSKCVLFERDLPYNQYYDHSDDYYKHKRIPVVMSASLQKFPNCCGVMGYTGHDAIFFRGCGCKQVPINVFGSFFKLPKFYQIKPYAIWP